MTTAYEIPLTAQPQNFEIELAGRTYRLVLGWNQSIECWVLDIRNTDDTLVLGGIPVVTGLDLLAQYEYLNFGGALMAQTDHNPDAVPTLENLGQEGRVYFVVED